LTTSKRLRGTIDLVRGNLVATIRAVWSHPRFGDLYPEFLFATYAVTAASAPAMRIAAERAAALPPDDPLAGWLRDYLFEHAEEERDHEQWILDDLASLGIPRDKVLARLPYLSAVALVGAQYYWMLHVHPIAYLGYIAVLEQPSSLDFLEEVSTRSGIPLSSMSAHVHHATLDPGHVAEFDRTLDGLSLTERQREIITISAVTTVAHLQDVFSELLARFDAPDGLYEGSRFQRQSTLV
jgi:hypothetical protein